VPTYEDVQAVTGDDRESGGGHAPGPSRRGRHVGPERASGPTRRAVGCDAHVVDADRDAQHVVGGVGVVIETGHHAERRGCTAVGDGLRVRRRKGRAAHRESDGCSYGRYPRRAQRGLDRRCGGRAFPGVGRRHLVTCPSSGAASIVPPSRSTRESVRSEGPPGW
jgi:hypothetical protein